MAKHTYWMPAITHNPWHPTCELSSEGRERVSKEIAWNNLERFKERHPGEAVTVVIGDTAYAGFIPNG